MIIKTRVFELSNGTYHSLSDLAKAMGLSVSQVYRVREGKRGINEKFIIGAKKAFPNYRLDELFYFKYSPSADTMMETTITARYNHIVQRFTAPDLQTTQSK
jgi:transcriptional regulator with XRE-family HTH domain